MPFKRTFHKFSNFLISNTIKVGLIKNNGEVHVFLQELFIMTLRIALYNFRTTFEHFINAVPLKTAANKWATATCFDLQSVRQANPRTMKYLKMAARIWVQR
jgi:hypothetical protein